MKHITFLFFLLINLGLTNVSSQSDFRSGYYITNNDDTVRGLIEYRSEVSNSMSCKFKKDINSDEIKFLPGEIKSYRFNDGKFYVSRELPNDSTNKTKIVFLEWLIKGKASILLYLSPLNFQYYVLFDNDSLYELRNTKSIITDKTGNKYASEKKQYIGELTYYFRDCPSIFPDIKKVSLDNSSLIKIAKSYHEKVCNNEDCIVYETKKNNIKYSVAPVISYISTQSYLNNGYDESIKPNSTMGYGLSLNLSNIQFISQKITYQIEFSYYQINYEIGSPKWPNIYPLFKSKTIRMPLSVKYTYPLNFIRPFISVGPTISYRIISNINYESMYLIGKGSYDNIKQTYYSKFEIAPWQFAVNAQVGFDIILNNNLKLEMNACIERGFRIIYMLVADKTYNNNIIIGCSLFYDLN